MKFFNFMGTSTSFLRSIGRRFSGTIAHNSSGNNLKMKAWQVHDYCADLLLASPRIPVVSGINELLIKVEAASVNPIDLYMKGGYARTVLNLLRNNDNELPLTLGRDFSGTVIRKGLATHDKFKIGDEVYGFVSPHKQGSFAEYVLVEDNHVFHKPKQWNAAESCSLVYTAMTAWAALFITGGLQCDNKHNINKRVLILGASGGVGTVAVQLLKSQGIHVTGTCSTDAVPMVRSLGADEVLDYTHPDYFQQISESRFQIILDCAQFGADNIPSNWKFEQFITLNSPLMVNTDKHGVIVGLLKSGGNLLSNNVHYLKGGKVVKWGFFMPSRKGFEFVHNLILNKKIKPMIHKQYDFAHLPEAFGEVEKGHLRGKVIVAIK